MQHHCFASSTIRHQLANLALPMAAFVALARLCQRTLLRSVVPCVQSASEVVLDVLVTKQRRGIKSKRADVERDTERNAHRCFRPRSDLDLSLVPQAGGSKGTFSGRPREPSKGTFQGRPPARPSKKYPKWTDPILRYVCLSFEINLL